MATKPVTFDESVFGDTEESPEVAARKARQKLADAVAPVIQELNEMAGDAVTRRNPIEKRWLEDLRQYHGVYEADVASVLTGDASRSQVFINITRPKTNAWAARMGDMLFPNDEKNWGINPTPVPQLTGAARDAAKLAQQATDQAEGHVADHNAQVDRGGEPDGSALLKAQDAADIAQQAKKEEKRRAAELEEAKKRAKSMETVIDDQLVESNYPARCRDAIDDETRLGVCVVKGPILNGKSKRYWEVDDKGNATLVTDDDPAPKARRVNPWHFFPDPTAESMEDCGFTFERHLPNKKMLRKMAREIGFDTDVVAKLLKEGPRASGPAGSPDLSFMAELRSMESGRGDGGDTVDALKDRYLVWEYHGPLEAEQVADMVRMMGRPEDADALAEAGMIEVPMVRIFFCGADLLKIEEDYLLDSCSSVYSVGTFEKGDACVLGGIGVPRLMRNEQQMLNSAVRMMLDNAALAVGPQLIVDKEQIAPENGEWKLTPRKVWQWIVGAGQTRREKPFESVDIPMNQEMLAAIVQLAVKFTDEAVAMPLIAQGEMGSHVTKTSSGMSMLFNSANVVFRRVVKNWDDDISAPLIQRFYEFNMQFSKREDIKGDMRVQARGTSVLLVREMQAEQLMAIIREWSMHPLLGVGFRAYHAMRMVLQAMSIEADSVLIPEDEYLEKLKAMSEAPKQSPEDIRAQTALDVAKIDAASRKEQADSNERIAQMRVQQAFAELGANRDISLAQIQAMFQTTALKESSKERQLAAEIAVERENAREARARGDDPTGSGGAISMGSQPQ